MSSTYRRLHELVVSGTLLPGTRLGEVPLASRLGVSRPTMREALRRLEGSGLAHSDGRSLRVARMSAAELRSALLMRASLEALHAELAAKRVADGEVAPAQLGRLRRLADDAERATETGDTHLAVVHNRAFHQAIDGLAGSQVSAAAVDTLWDRVLVATRHSLATGERRESVGPEHRELIEAITAGRGADAADLALRHVRATLGVLDLPLVAGRE
ncbi:GntR family transcriptional regulator [Qaidamihabitans albus]|uniref:GntR family transcriptional regulator n=1 Tax=Qaidamihabitans albus TaxID=2795733 RepID=UPI0018F1A396|nr:GntR family transcriptional regulator [Qaidamihabitans albus]